ncbi:MAG: hypothetical protein RR310_04540 [Eubacterium sp.]
MGMIQEKDREVFQVLLVHWINHSAEHVKGYREWADKTVTNYPEVSKEIGKAIDCMEQAAQKLMEAKIDFQKK